MQSTYCQQAGSDWQEGGLTSAAQLRAALATLLVLSNASQQPSEASMMRPPVLGTSICTPRHVIAREMQAVLKAELWPELARQEQHQSGEHVLKPLDAAIKLHAESAC